MSLVLRAQARFLLLHARDANTGFKQRVPLPAAALDLPLLFLVEKMHGASFPYNVALKHKQNAATVCWVTEAMIGHRLGEFSPTRVVPQHKTKEAKGGKKKINPNTGKSG
eukprot:1156302-Pelagomonas_calceolata.AAC.2